MLLKHTPTTNQEESLPRCTGSGQDFLRSVRFTIPSPFFRGVSTLLSMIAQFKLSRGDRCSCKTVGAKVTSKQQPSAPRVRRERLRVCDVNESASVVPAAQG